MSALKELAAAVDGDRLMQHCVEFAKRVKLSGTPEERESFLYLQGRMEEYGYRTELIDHDAYISLPGEARVECQGEALTSITHSFSLSSPAGGLTAPLVDLADGSAKSFASVDCRGRIVLVDGIASPAVAARAAAAGAAGQLHVSPHEHLHEMCISPVWGNPSADTRGALPLTVACTVSQADGQALRMKLAGGPIEVTLHAKVDTGWRKTPLLVAEIDGPGGVEEPFVLLSGHHDTWYFGVMDNGSANATMLEAARLLAERRADWRRGLRVCFWSGHSHGRYSGSTWYVDRNWRDLDKRCVAHVNVDSTGGIGATEMGLNGVVSSLVGLADAATFAETGQHHAGHRPSRSSDQSFWGIGVPSMYGSISQQPEGAGKMRNALGWWWHTPLDLIDKIDRDFLVRDTRVVLHTLVRLLADRVLPIDPTAQLSSLKGELAKLGGAARPLAAELEKDADAALSAVATLPTAGNEDAANAALIRICRLLVPLDYTSGDRFAHDPALPVPAWPVLDSLRALSTAVEGSDDARFASVGAVRARNRLGRALADVAAAAVL